MSTSDAHVKQMRLMQGVFLFTIVAFAGVGEVMGPLNEEPIDPVFRMAITLVAAGNLVAMVVLRRSMVGGAEERLRTHPEDVQTWVRWRTGQMITLVLGETIALFGLVLRVMGASLEYAAMFYVCAVLAILLHTPRAPNR